MFFWKRIKCSLGSKCGIPKVFLCLVLVTLMVVIDIIGWLPATLFSSHIQMPNVFPLKIRKLRRGGAETDELELRNYSDTPTTQPETSSIEEPLKQPIIYDYLINEPDKCKDNNPFLVLLIIVERWQKEARQAIRETWGKEDHVPGVKILRLFFLGKDTRWTDIDELPLMEESQAYGDIIQQDYLDTYNNLTIKVLMGLHWVATHCPGASYAMKTDSDMFVNTEYLINLLLKPDQPPRLNYFTGFIIDDEPDRNPDSKWYVSLEQYPGDKYPLFCSGTGYVFSADLAGKIVKVSTVVRWLHLEDVFVGLCLDRLGILPVAAPKLTDFNNQWVPYTDCGYNQLITAHAFRPWELKYFWNQLQSNKHACAANSTIKPSSESHKDFGS